jgi:transglutaminase-like putative cysteine protease
VNRVRPLPAALLLLALPAGSRAEQQAVYRVAGADARLFDQYDNDGYSLSVSSGPDGALELRVRVSDAPLVSRAPFPTRTPLDPLPRPAPERDAFTRVLVAGATREADAVARILVGIASRVRYDPDRIRSQDPGSVFAEGRASCVGFAELAVDLLRRAGVRARTVQGILRTDPGSPGYEAALGGSYHRWIEVWYADRGYVFSDPSASINGVDARYLPFVSRALVRPRSLALVGVARFGDLAYGAVRAGTVTLRARAVQ